MVTKNQKLTLECTGFTHDALGVCKHDGFAIFVKGMIKGELGEIVVTKVKKNIAFGKLNQLIKKSPSRVKYGCSVYKQCGGCHIGHLNDSLQQLLKDDKVYQAFKRIGEQEIVVHPTVIMDNPLRYRNKVAIPVRIQDNKMVSGFYKSRSHEVIDVKDCLVQTIESNQIIDYCKSLFKKYNISLYDEINHKGLIRHVIIREGFKTNQIMIVFVTNGEHFPNKDNIVKDITSSFPQVKTIVQNINTSKTSVILGQEVINMYGDGYIYDYINDIKFKISSKSFYQINQVQTEKLYNKALELADLNGNETVLDAYCGIGSISLHFAKKAKKVIGIEIVEQAIVDAKENAKLNDSDNAFFYAGDVKAKVKEINEKFDVVVVDPPRKGCDTEFLDFIANEIKPDKLIYISCDVSTQARDVKYLSQYGYVTNECYPYDMFPQTHHVETIVKLKLL